MKSVMKKNNIEVERDRPAEKGRNNDPNLRDRSDEQPGVSTISDSPTDKDNQDLSKTSRDSYREDEEEDKKADKSFDE
jgi:hypothetical protein